MRQTEINKRTYKSHDFTEHIEKAKNTLAKIKKKKIKMYTYRIDSDTLIQIREGKDLNKVINKLRNKRKITTITQEIEHEQYA